MAKLLLADPEVKAAFFAKMEGHWIFDASKFVDYTAQKNFLDDSYTRFRNHNNLTIGNKFLRERG